MHFFYFVLSFEKVNNTIFHIRFSLVATTAISFTTTTTTTIR